MSGLPQSRVRLSREEYRKSKELEELRKSGAAPPELDDDGKMINPHIPQYIVSAPWYLYQSRPGLKHQYGANFGKKGGKPLHEQHWHNRGVDMRARRATKYRKGACKNCGAMTHKTKECVERPRKRGACWTNSGIMPDEYVPSELKGLGFEGKRDRWNGYDPASHRKVVERFERTDAARKARKHAELDKETAAKHAKKRKKGWPTKDNDDGDGNDNGDGNGEDEDTRAAAKVADDDVDDDMDDLKDSGEVIQKRDARTRTTVRNLRIREDTAKYLLNLDPNSAYYDPKSRSMRANPHDDKSMSEHLYAGDLFVRQQGEVRDVHQMQAFVWEVNRRGGDGGSAGTAAEINTIANPSQAQKMHEEFQHRRKRLKESRRQKIIDRYGGQEHTEQTLSREMLLAQSEAYAEYAPDGTVIRGQEEVVPKTKYTEDVYEQNHTQVWGSYWSHDKRRWGYACCRQLIRNCYCVSETTRQKPPSISGSKRGLPSASPPHGSVRHKPAS